MTKVPKGQVRAFSAEFLTSKVILVEDFEEIVDPVLTVDGKPVPFRLERDGDMRFVPLPRCVIDGEVHQVSLAMRVDGVPAKTSGEVRADYVGSIDQITNDLGGWLYDRNDPSRIIDLEVEVDFTTMLTTSTGVIREDHVQVGHKARGAGFFTSIPRPQRPGAPRIIAIRIAGTSLYPFGTVVASLSDASHVQALLAASPVGRNPIWSGVVLPRLVGALRSGTLDFLPKGTVSAGMLVGQRPGPPMIDVVVPVYRGKDETLDCLRSVIAGRGSIPYRLVVIDDCSPEKELSAALDGLAAKDEITLIRNDENLGFVASVNRGMSFSARNDVVLLNSDTIVPKGWLDRLYAAAYGDECIATVTPLSNNATICSLPEIGGIVGFPYRSALAEIDDVCRRVNRGKTVDLPTAHGFCMFIKRAAISEVGLFDAETFGKGYGEENDFSLRAAARGWRNVAACDVFVQHLGSVSFGPSKLGLSERNQRLLEERYPDYHRQVMEFIRSDPLAPARNAIQKEYWRGRRIVVIVALSIGGGVSRHINTLVDELRSDGFLPLILRCGEAEKNIAFMLSAAHGHGERLIYPLGPDALEAVMADILELGPEFIEVHHLIDFDGPVADCIRLSGIPYRVMLHDFFYLCPRVSLLDDATTFCGVPAAKACDRCVARGGAHPAMSATLSAAARNVSRWRAVWREFLAAAAQVIAPSRDTAQWYGKHMPDLHIDVVPHEIMTETKVESRTGSTDVLKVAVIGAIGPHKGMSLLLSLLRHAERWAPDIEFTVVGHTSNDAALTKFENVRVTGPYPPADAAKRVAEADCSVALFLSPWPETYSYTFSEALAAGLTPVAIGYGAFVERIEALSHGRLLKPEANPAEIIEVLRDAGKLTARRFEFTPARAPFPALAADRAPVRLIGRPEGAFADGWLGLRAKLVLYLRDSSAMVELSLFVPKEMHGQYVILTLNGERVGRHPVSAGQITRFTVPLEGKQGLNTLELKFDFEFYLSEVDLRRASAVLSEMRIKTRMASCTVRMDGSITPDTGMTGGLDAEDGAILPPWESSLV